MGVPGAIIDSENFVCEDVHRHIETPRESQQPGKKRLAGHWLNIEREFSYSGWFEYSL